MHQKYEFLLRPSTDIAILDLCKQHLGCSPKLALALLIGATILQVPKSTTMSLWYHYGHCELWVIRTPETDTGNADFEVRNLDEV